MRAVKIPRLEQGSIGPRTESWVNWHGHMAMVPCLHQGIIYTKRKLRVWRNQKCIPLVGAITPLPVQAVKVPCLEGGSIMPRKESCINWDGPISMVPCLHHGNIYTKRKLRVWRNQKCIPLVGAITLFAPWKYLYQKEAKGMEKPEMYSASRCNNLTYLCVPSKFSVPREAV